jgi:hypothetical protein
MYAHQDAILLLYHESHALDARSQHTILGRVGEFIDAFERLLAEAARQGRVAPGNARLAANIVTFLPTIVALRRWDLRRRVPRQAQVRGITEFLLRGLGAPGPSNGLGVRAGDGARPPAAAPGRRRAR